MPRRGYIQMLRMQNYVLEVVSALCVAISRNWEVVE